MSAPPVSKKSLFLVGDTISFVTGPALWSKEIMSQGTVVETSIAGKKSYFVWGAKAMEAFYNEAYISRAPIKSPLDPFVFDNQRDVSPVLDGEAHTIRKAALISAHTSDHVEHYLNTVASMTEEFIMNFKSDLPAEGTEIKLFPKLHEFQVQFMTRLFFTADADETFQKEVNLFLKGMVGLPINLPGTSHYNGLKATEWLIDFSRQQLVLHRENPDKYHDTMSILIKSSKLSDEEVILELHHFMFAMTAVSIVVCAAIAGSHLNPGVLEKLNAEIQKNKSLLHVGERYSEHLITKNFPYTRNTIKEALRLYPIIPFQQGISLVDFEINGYKIPSESHVMGGLYATDIDPTVYENPEVFNPERFETLGDVETSWIWTPFGGGERAKTHRCAGQPTALAISTYLLAKLVLNFNFEVLDKDQHLGYSLFDGPTPTNDMPVKIRAL